MESTLREEREREREESRAKEIRNEVSRERKGTTINASREREGMKSNASSRAGEIRAKKLELEL